MKDFVKVTQNGTKESSEFAEKIKQKILKHPMEGIFGIFCNQDFGEISGEMFWQIFE